MKHPEPDLPLYFPAADAVITPLPDLAAYRDAHPAVLGEPPADLQTRRFWRKRVVIGFAVAAALHIALVLGWLLTPPLRLKVGYGADRWVHVVSVPPDPPPKSSPR